MVRTIWLLIDIMAVSIISALLCYNIKKYRLSLEEIKMDNFKLAVRGVFKRAVESFQTYPSAMGNALLFAVVAIVRINLEW